MKKALLPLFAPLVAVMLASCSSADIDNKDAVRAAIVEYLQDNQAATGLDVSQLTIGIDAVVFERDLARATVSFAPKSGGDMSMQWNYTLERQGNKWGNVKRDAAMGPHGVPGVAAPPAGAPGAPPAPSTGPLPAGHPAVPGQTK